MTLALYSIDFISRFILQLIPSFPFIFVKILIMVFPTVGYLDQIRLMIMRKDPNVYTTNAALILISANVIKIVFFFDEPYAIVIFGQCVFLPIVALIHTYLHFKYLDIKDIENKTPIHKNKFLKYLNIFKNAFNNPKQAMRIYSCITFEQFCTSLFFYFSIFIVLYFILRFTIGIPLTVNIFSVSASLIDSCVSIPAFVLIVIQGNIETTSTVLVMQYLFGDMFKIMLFKASHTPWPFIFGGFVQLTLDSMISIRYAYLSFKKNKSKGDNVNVKASESLSDIPIKD